MIKIKNGRWSHDCIHQTGTVYIPLGESCPVCRGTLHDEQVAPVQHCVSCGNLRPIHQAGCCGPCVRKATDALGVEAADVSTVRGYDVRDVHPTAEVHR